MGQYKSLNKIDQEAWTIITTTFNGMVVSDKESMVVEDTTTVVSESPFSERLLRDILDLDPVQQIFLCQELAKGAAVLGRRALKSRRCVFAGWPRLN